MKDTDRRSFLLSGIGFGAGAAAKSQTPAQTEAEAAAGGTPQNTGYPVGDVRRYGADPPGKRDSSAAWASAISSNDYVFDGSPGGGTYLFGSEVVISRYPVSISGAV